MPMETLVAERGEKVPVIPEETPEIPVLLATIMGANPALLSLEDESDKVLTEG